MWCKYLDAELVGEALGEGKSPRWRVLKLRFSPARFLSPVHGAFREAVSARRSRRVAGAPRSSGAPFTGLLGVPASTSTRELGSSQTARSPVNGLNRLAGRRTRRERRADTASPKAP